MMTKYGSVLVYTTWHIITIVMILFIAMLRRSFISLGYVLAFIPFIKNSSDVLKQFEMYKNFLKLKEKIKD